MSTEIGKYGKSREWVKALVVGHVSNTEIGLIDQIVDHIMETGDSVWHAASTICKTVCWCARCAPNNKNSGPEASPELAKARVRRDAQRAEVVS